MSEIEELNRKITSLEAKIDSLFSRLDSHITFVDSVYQKVRIPIDFICSKFTGIMGSIYNPSVSQIKIKNENEVAIKNAF